ncbi:MAG: molybdopterin-guanine dinucleotide biosynthesis protein MobB [Clostridiales bacterium]
MKIFAVSGLSNTGKTTVVCALVRELKGRGFSVATVKSSSCQDISFGAKDCDTGLHAAFGAEQTALRWPGGTAVFYRPAVKLADILAQFSQDIVILEGFASSAVPKIITVAAFTDLTVKKFCNGFAFSGVLAGTGVVSATLPLLNCFTQIKELADLALQMAWTGDVQDWREKL